VQLSAIYAILFIERIIREPLIDDLVAVAVRQDTVRPDIAVADIALRLRTAGQQCCTQYEHRDSRSCTQHGAYLPLVAFFELPQLAFAAESQPIRGDSW